MRTIALLCLAAALTACGGSETSRAREEARRNDVPADISCRSFGELIFQGRSTGRVRYSESGRLTFVNAENGRLTSIDAECMVVSTRPQPAT